MLVNYHIQAVKCHLFVTIFFSAGARLQTGTGGEGPKTVWTAHQQQCFPAVLHPNPRVSERLLHARPRQRRLLDHDRFAK